MGKTIQVNGNTVFQTIAIMAIRYSVGRETYMPSLVIGYLSPMLLAFDLKTIENMESIIKSAPSLGNDIIDKPGWLRFLNSLAKAKQHIAEGKHKEFKADVTEDDFGVILNIAFRVRSDTREAGIVAKCFEEYMPYLNGRTLGCFINDYDTEERCSEFFKPISLIDDYHNWPRLVAASKERLNEFRAKQRRNQWNG